jgi:general stress protein 26
MNSTGRTIRVWALPLLLGFILATPVATHGQEKGTGKAERSRLIAAAREIMAAARYCALITLDSTGHPQARTMDPFSPGEDMVVWLGTNPKSRKVREIRNNPHVTLYYFDAQERSYVAISGIARVVNNPRERARHWKDEWKAFYPDREQDYLLISVTPRKLEVVSEKKGIAGNSTTWDPPVVKFSSGRSID